MFTKGELDSVINATLCFHEMFKKFVQGSMPDEINTKLQMNIALTLHATGAQSMTALSRRTNVAPEQVTRAISKLRASGVVVCEKNPENKRMVIAQLTSRGEELVATHLKTTDERLAAYLAALPEGRAQLLIDASKTAASVLFAHDINDPSMPILR